MSDLHELQRIERERAETLVTLIRSRIDVPTFPSVSIVRYQLTPEEAVEAVLAYRKRIIKDIS